MLSLDAWHLKGCASMSPTCQFWWNWFVQALIAVGTIGAVIVALFGDWLRAVFAPPRLLIRLADPTGVIAQTELQVGGQKFQTESRWYHVRVQNLRRWSPAREVRLFLLRYEEPDSLGQLQTKWTGAIPMKWRHQEIKELAPTLGPPDDADLCSVIKVPAATGLPHRLELHPLIRAISIPANWVSPCKFAVTLQARSLEVESNLY
jgi:hypothetical protein